MSQSAIIAAALVAGFFIFITVKGELPAYGALFFGGSSGSSAPTATVSTNTNSAGTVATNAAANSPASAINNVFGLLHQMEAPAANANTLEL